MAVKRGLGRGFDSLIPTPVVETEFDVTAKVDESGKRVSGDMVLEVAPELVDPNPHQPRKVFDAEALEALAASIRVHGILQPMVVTKQGSRYELIAGERRLRAAKIAGLDAVPVIVRTMDEQQKLEVALLENIQREDLNPLEVATAYRKLVDEFNLSLTDLESKVGRDKTTISNTMRLLNLQPSAKQALVEKKITEGHARAVLMQSDPEAQEVILKMVLEHGWNVRQTETYARDYRKPQGSKMAVKMRIMAENQITKSISDYLGAKVVMQRKAKGGRILIDYYSDEELERIYRAIRHDG
ncbi:MAG TPA: ParB/RepB/Spo0J family partition protein [Candidatus Saccharimonadia bacterium]|jgi:ParB family chromosome partitioning protein